MQTTSDQRSPTVAGVPLFLLLPGATDMHAHEPCPSGAQQSQAQEAFWGPLPTPMYMNPKMKAHDTVMHSLVKL